MERCSSSRGTIFCGPKKHCRGYILPLFIPFFIHSSFLFHSFSFLFNLFSSLFISFHHFFIHFLSLFRHFFVTFSSFPPLSPLYLPLPPLIPPLSNTLINSRLTIKVVEVVIKSAKKFWGWMIGAPTVARKGQSACNPGSRRWATYSLPFLGVVCR